MGKAVLPFLTIPDEAINASPWSVRLSTGREYSDPDYIDEWDNGTDLSLCRSIEIDLGKCFETLCIPDDSELLLVVAVGTGAGSLPVERWFHRYLIDLENSVVSIELNQPGETLADALHLETTVLLARSVPVPLSPISPVHEGSIVWQEKKRIRLEGDVSRFPVSETDLGQLLGEEWKDALWYLQVDWDPATAFDSSVRLHVNSLQKEFASRFRQGDPETVHAVMADVISQVTTGCLALGEEWEFNEVGGDTAVSLGQVAGHWLESAFGTIDAARQAHRHTPARFHAHLNALAAQNGGEE